ncbi:hypothetical protein HN51_006420, partial [Arachis hypogaea]
MLSFHINLFNQRNSGGVVQSSHGGGGLFLVDVVSAFFSNTSYALWLIIIGEDAGVEVKMLSFHINLFNQRNGGGVVHSSHGGGGLFFVGAMSAFFSNASYALWL